MSNRFWTVLFLLVLMLITLTVAVPPLMASAGGEPIYVLKQGEVWNGYFFYEVNQREYNHELFATISNVSPALGGEPSLEVGDSIVSLNKRLTVVSISSAENEITYTESFVEPHEIQVLSEGFTLATFHDNINVLGWPSPFLRLNGTMVNYDNPSESRVRIGSQEFKLNEPATLNFEISNTPIAQVMLLWINESEFGLPQALFRYRLEGNIRIMDDGEEFMPALPIDIDTEGNISMRLNLGVTADVYAFTPLFTLRDRDQQYHAVILISSEEA